MQDNYFITISTMAVPIAIEKVAIFTLKCDLLGKPLIQTYFVSQKAGLKTINPLHFETQSL